MDVLKFLTEFTTNPKENSRKATSFIILVLLLAYAYCFFDVLIQENGIVSSALLIFLFLLIKSVIADYDPLYSGDSKKNRYIKAFQKNLPTQFIMEQYGVDMKEAKSLWYNVFNKWADKNHQMHYNWETSLARGFKCRMVYFTIISFKYMLILIFFSISLIGFVNYYGLKFNIDIVDKYFIDHQNLFCPIIFFILCLIIFLSFMVINYPSDKKPRGCFLRFNEINEINISWLKENIKSKTDFMNYG
jgi:hypothetical protein